MANVNNTTSLAFEEKIWSAADTLRGNLSASEYEGVVLGLIFLKYISDKFEAKYKELKEVEDDGEPFEEKSARLAGELKELFALSHVQEEEIRKQLGSIGIEI